METVRKKFRPLVKRGPSRTEKYVVLFSCTEPAPSCDGIERCSSLNTCPIDVMWDIVALEGLYMGAECGRSIRVIINLCHVGLVPLLESNSTTSVGFSCIIV